MAGIDKTYIDGRDYPEYRQWWIDNYDKMVKELGAPIWLYTFGFYYPIDPITPDFLQENTADLAHYRGAYDFPIWNTSEKKDLWLIKNCPICSFRERMLSVYPKNWVGFKRQSWIPKGKDKPKCIK